jgi:phage-related protein
MNAKFLIRIPAVVLTLLLALGLATRAQAQANPNTVLLDDAYATLAHADHDYKGHRAKAMEQIKAGLKELGTDISSHGRGREPQGTSDAQLRAALDLLQQAKTGLAGKPHRHIDNAIKQLNIALAIK